MRRVLALLAIPLLIAMRVPTQAQIAEQDYDIPAQPVPRALAALATAGHINLAFEPARLDVVRSSPVRGRHTPQTALQALLAGTGLEARFTGPSSAIVVASSRPMAGARASVTPVTRPTIALDLAEVRAPYLLGRSDPGRFIDYARAAQRQLLAMLDDDPAYHGRLFDLEVGVRIDPAGRIVRVDILRASQDAARDAALAARLRGRDLPPPPGGLKQPMRFDISATGAGGSQR